MRSNADSSIQQLVQTQRFWDSHVSWSSFSGCYRAINSRSDWNDFFATNPAEVQNWGVAFLYVYVSAIESVYVRVDHGDSIALQTGAFSFIGIEIPAVTALEAKMDIPVSVLNQTSDQNIGRWPITTARKALWWACARLPLFVGPLYLIMGLLATVNVDRANPALQTLGNEVAANANIEHCAKVDSIFVISAMDSSIAHLHDVFTAFVLLTAWTSANTALYVSSRTLYGLTCNYKYLPVDEDWPRWYACLWNFRVWVGTTWTTFHHKSIPIPALIVSTVVFCWVPFLQLARVTTTTQVCDKIQYQCPRVILISRADTVCSDGAGISILRPRMGMRMLRLSSI